MEQDRNWRIPQPEVLLQIAYTQHEDEGGNTQQSINKVVKFKMGSECNYTQNNIIGIKLLCDIILAEITPRNWILN